MKAELSRTILGLEAESDAVWFSFGDLWAYCKLFSRDGTDVTNLSMLFASSDVRACEVKHVPVCGSPTAAKVRGPRHRHGQLR